MASIVDFLKANTASATTIPRLGINNELYQLQRESEHYFVIPAAAQAINSSTLAVVIKEGQHFHSTNTAHSDFLNKSIALFKQKAIQLHRVDQYIGASIAFGVVATVLSFLPLVGFLGWVGWGSAIYHINQRALAYSEYYEALTLLVGACNWSVGEEADQRKDRSLAQLTANESVRAMIATLYPLLSKTQVNHLIADDVEAVFAQELNDYDAKFQSGFNPYQFFAKKDDAVAISKKGAEFHRCIYGFNKGGYLDFFDALIAIIPDLYKAAQHGLQQLNYWWQERGHTEKHTEEPVTRLELAH